MNMHPLASPVEIASSISILRALLKGAARVTERPDLKFIELEFELLFIPYDYIEFHL